MSLEFEIYYAIQSARAQGKDIREFLELVRENWQIVLAEEAEHVNNTVKEILPCHD